MSGLFGEWDIRWVDAFVWWVGGCLVGGIFSTESAVNFGGWDFI